MQDSLKKYCNSSSLIYHCFNSNILKNLFLKNFDERDKFFHLMGHLTVTDIINTRKDIFI